MGTSANGFPEIDLQDLVGLGEALPGGELRPIVHDDDAKAHRRAHGAHRLCDMTRADDHQVRMGVMRLHIHLDRRSGSRCQLMDALLRGSAFFDPLRSERQGRFVEICIAERTHEAFGAALGLTDHHPLAHELWRSRHRNDERDRLAGLLGIEHLCRRLHGREWRVLGVRHRYFFNSLLDGDGIPRASDGGTLSCRRCR